MRVVKSIKDIDGLATRLLALEDSAFDEFAHIFGPRLRAFFIRRGLTISDAEDLAVTCVTDIALKVDKYKAIREGGFGAWVYTLARHALADWKQEHPMMESLPEDLEMKRDETDEETNLDTILAVQDALAGLTETDQSLIHLRYAGVEHSYAEIGERQGVSADAARVRHFRTLKKLKTILEKDPRIKKLLERSDKG